MEIKIINKSGLPLPKYETDLAAGCDLRANIAERIGIFPRERKIIPTGIHIQLPKGYEAQVRGRSGLNAKYGIICPTGTIDADYTGEIKVILYNLGNSVFTIDKGDRIAQLVISPIVQAEWKEVDSLETTTRGEKGFGSTGK